MTTYTRGCVQRPVEASDFTMTEMYGVRGSCITHTARVVSASDAELARTKRRVLELEALFNGLIQL